MEKSAFNPDWQNNSLPDKIVVGLERIAAAFRALLWEHAKVIGLSPIQIQILIFVAFHNEPLCNVSHLAKEFNVTKPTISDAIKTLEKKGYIEKRSSATDGRAYSIFLTNDGQRTVKNIKHFADPVSSIVATLSEKEQTQVYASLSKLIYALNQEGILSVQRTCYSCTFYEKKKKVHYCHLLKTELSDKDIRIDCPEHKDK